MWKQGQILRNWPPHGHSSAQQCVQRKYNSTTADILNLYCDPLNLPDGGLYCMMQNNRS